MRTNKLLIFSVAVMSLSFVTCSRFLTCLEEQPKEILSKDKTITEVIVNTNPKVTATVDDTKITASVPFGTDLTKVTLAITHSGASIFPLPETPQDFSSGKSVKYTVKAEDDSTQDYAVSITLREQTQFTISFNTDGGNTIASTKVKKGKKATAPNEPIRQGFKFKEWQLDDKIFDFNNTPMTKDITLKAIWIETLNASSTDWDIINSPEGYYIIKYKGSATDVVIPTTVDGNKIVGIKTAIGTENIFGGTIFVATNITSIDFSNAVYLKKIDEKAFQYCTRITSITLPESVTSIGNYTFYDCTALTSIRLPESLTSIGNNAFSTCTSLTSIRLPDSITSIGNYTFDNCSRLTSINIPDAVTSIGGFAFQYCTSLTSIRLPESLTSIGGNAFSNCTALTSIRLPESVTSIGVGAFQYCTSLTSMNIPDAVTSIGNYTFTNCTALTSVKIPDAVTSIGNYTFTNCTALTSITIPDAVTSIGNGTFANCTALTSVTIPDAVTSIGNGAFASCTRITSITIPDAVTSIGNGAFFGTGITKITLPKSCTYKANSFNSGVNVINGIPQ